jgi:hypothetical protein
VTVATPDDPATRHQVVTPGGLGHVGTVLDLDFTTSTTRCHEIDSGHDVRVFEPKEFKGGRVKVYGCSPGCLLVSIVLSVFLTLAVNSCLHLVG